MFWSITATGWICKIDIGDARRDDAFGYAWFEAGTARFIAAFIESVLHRKIAFISVGTTTDNLHGKW
jgi:hypothetical protein